MQKIESLISQKLIIKIIGDIAPDKSLSLAMVIQARSKPKYPFKAFIALSSFLSTEPLMVYVDNLYSQAFLNRSDEEQSLLDRKYLEFFTDSDCKICFSKNLFGSTGLSPFSCLMNLAAQVPISEFRACLPIEKRNRIAELKLDEIIHLLMELFLLEEVKKDKDVLLVGHSSQAIVATHRNIATKPLSAIVVPRFSNTKEVDGYIEKLSQQRAY